MRVLIICLWFVGSLAGLAIGFTDPPQEQDSNRQTLPEPQYYQIDNAEYFPPGKEAETWAAQAKYQHQIETGEF